MQMTLQGQLEKILPVDLKKKPLKYLANVLQEYLPDILLLQL